MAHTFDNRNHALDKQNSHYSAFSSPLIQCDTTNSLLETSKSLRKQNIHQLSNEENALNRSLANFQNPKSLHHLSSASKDPLYLQQQLLTDRDSLMAHKDLDSFTKLPPSTRVSRITSTTNNNYMTRRSFEPQSSSNEFKTNKTYLNSAQLYISQAPSHQPLTIPTRKSSQKNSVHIPHFNSFLMPNIASIVNMNDHLSDSLLFDDSDNNNNNNNNNHFNQELNNVSMNREYFGECPKCGETITSSDDPCDILGQIYHSSCAVCVLCGRSVKNKQFFIKDQLYCEEDFLYSGFQQALEYCVACNHLIPDTIVQALGKSYHLSCFKCSKCSITLDGKPFTIDKNQNIFCLRDYHMTYGPRCYKCSHSICPEDGSNETLRIISMHKTYHVQCYKCEDCGLQLGDEQERRCYPLDDTLLCKNCCHQRVYVVDKF